MAWDPDGTERMRIVREWSDEKLIRELRSGLRARLGIEDYRHLLAEGMARLLERGVL